VVKKRKMLKDERGQMGIDFIAGVSLFMLTLLFLVHFIPGMFVPFQSETIDLSSVAYRTSVILVEDPGWWDNGTGIDYGEDWEKANHVDNVSRVGLAIDKKHPNMLNMSKINAFENNITYENLTDKLGLYRNISGNEIDYGYSITLRGLDGTIMATGGETSPEYGDVSSMKRIVSVSVSEYGWINGDQMSGAEQPVKPLIMIDNASVSRFCNDDLYIRITNFTFTGGGPPGKFLSVKIVQTNISNEPGDNLVDTGNGLHIKVGSGLVLNNPSDGYRQVNDGPMGKLNVPTNINSAEDILRIVINASAFQRAGFDTIDPVYDDVIIEINLNKINCTTETNPNELLNYSETEEIIQKPSSLIVKVWA
jgi:hypothetical protein